MKVSVISSANFSPAAVKQVKNYGVADQYVSEQKQENVNFKGKGFAILEGLGGAILGALVAGPIGAFFGGAAGVGVGSQMDDKGECSETDIDRCKEY